MSPNFWEQGDYKSAHLSRLILPDSEMKTIFEWCQNPSRFLVFMGNPGIGKTYLISAIIHDLYEKKQQHLFRYVLERDLFAKMRECFSKNWDYVQEIKRLCEAPFIFLDDLGQSDYNDKNFRREVVHNFIDCRSISGLPTVITSNLFVPDLRTTFEDRTVSRLLDKRNTIIELNWIDKRREGI